MAGVLSDQRIAANIGISRQQTHGLSQRRLEMRRLQMGVERGGIGPFFDKSEIGRVGPVMQQVITAAAHFPARRFE